MKLAYKLFLTIFGTSIVTISIVALIGFYLTQQAISHSITEQQLQLAKLTMDKVDRLLYERYVDIQTIAGDETIEEFLSSIEKDPPKQGEKLAYPEDFVRRVEELSVVTGPWERVDVMDLHGNIVYSLDKASIGKHVTQISGHEEIFKKALTGHVAYSDVLLDKDKKPIMSFATPIRNDADPSKKLIGAVITQLTWPAVLEVVHSVRGPIVDLYNSEGLEIANNDNSDAIFTENNSDEPHVKAALEGKEESEITKGVDGEQTVSSSAVEQGFLTYKGNGWILLVEQPTSIAFASATRSASSIMLVVVPLIILMNMFMLLLILRMFRPIQQLTQTSKEIANGDLSKRVRITSRDEIGQLGTAFNEMTDKLQELYKGLEQKVQEKTVELSQKVQELGQEKTKDEAILESIGDGMIVSDNSGKVLMMNHVVQQMLGLNNVEFRNKTTYELFQLTMEDGTVIPQEKRPLTLALQTGKKVSDMFYFAQKDQKPIAVNLTATPVIEEGKIIGTVEIVRDITKEKEVDRMKTEFISLASHQLRTPLSAIKWFSEMLVGGDAGELTPEQKDFAQNISDSTQRMIELVNGLLNVSRMESGRIVIDPKPTDLKELVDTLVKELQVKIKERQQTLIVSVHQDLPKINVDAKLIRQVYMNLLTNAIKYTPKGGEISVFISKKDNEVISQVADNGYGIPKAEQVKMFQKFFRATNIIKVETDGTGLGLYLIKAIIESSKGKLWFESYTEDDVATEKKHGTTFWFSLPMSGMEAKKGEVTLDE
jgi:PAS domain S-box-containing protein